MKTCFVVLGNSMVCFGHAIILTVACIMTMQTAALAVELIPVDEACVAVADDGFGNPAAPCTTPADPEDRLDGNGNPIGIVCPDSGCANTFGCGCLDYEANGNYACGCLSSAN